ncbi:MAG: DUF6600 domain-containing protein [Gammaproteobacteria bacterium]
MQTSFSNGFSPVRLGARAVMWVLASSLGAVALGQETVPDAPDAQDNADDVAPERVARLSFTQGGVSLQAVGETTWGPATVNRPMTPGDFLRTENDGRAEVQAGEAEIRLGAGTNFAFLTLDDDALRMRVSSGVLNVRVRTLGENEVVEIETPQAIASILRPGTYRLEVSANGNATVVKVSSGMLEARGAADQSFVVRAQQVATLTGTQRLAFTTATLGAPDAFDQWALERDRRDDSVLASDSARHVPEGVVGYEDLDSYGSWTSEPDYGYVWTPTRVVAGWSPYSSGHYSYVGGWGWAWIDDAPWGFAPFHYGRWVSVGSRWSWVPGRDTAVPSAGRSPERPAANRRDLVTAGMCHRRREGASPAGAFRPMQTVQARGRRLRRAIGSGTAGTTTTRPMEIEADPGVTRVISVMDVTGATVVMLATAAGQARAAGVSGPCRITMALARYSGLTP